MTYKIIFVILLVVYTIYKCVLDLLEIDSLKKKIPDNVSDIYDTEKYEKYCNYTKEQVACALVRHIVSLAFSLVIFLTPLLPLIGNAIENDYVEALAILGTTTIISTIVGIFFSLYDTFVIEEKYGFNKTTKATFIKDTIRDFILEYVLMYGLIALYIAMYQWIGLYSIILVSVVIAIFIIVLNLLMPIVVTLQFKKTPLEEGELRTKLVSLLESEGYQVKDIYVVDGSRRSTRANAFFTGFGKLKSIMLFDTLVDLMTPDEIVAVFAHELGHGVHKDTIKGLIMGIINFVIIVAGLILITKYIDLSTAFGFTSISYAFILLFSFEALLPIYSTLFGFIENKFSRVHEYQADNIAATKGYGKELISALKKLAVNNFSNLTPNPFVEALTYSHPSIGKRIEAIEKEINKQK